MSGNDPRQASTVWLDRSFGMGKSVREQIVGYDCPVDALYLPATVHDMFGTSTRKNAICVFERDSGKPLTRHTGWMKDEMGGTKGFELVVRTISTVGNVSRLRIIMVFLRLNRPGLPSTTTFSTTPSNWTALSRSVCPRLAMSKVAYGTRTRSPMATACEKPRWHLSMTM